MNDMEERVLTEIHNLCGICGHCGKRDCLGRETQSVLPEKLYRKDVITAIERAFRKQEVTT